MTITYIHDRGRVREIRQPETKFEDPTISKPATVQRSRPRGTWKGWREVKQPTAHNGYKPGFVYDLGADQCRYIPGDDHVMCGAQTDGVSSYCERHHALCVAAPRPPSPAVSLHGEAARVKRLFT